MYIKRDIMLHFFNKLKKEQQHEHICSRFTKLEAKEYALFNAICIKLIVRSF